MITKRIHEERFRYRKDHHRDPTLIVVGPETLYLLRLESDFRYAEAGSVWRDSIFGMNIEVALGLPKGEFFVGEHR